MVGRAFLITMLGALALTADGQSETGLSAEHRTALERLDSAAVCFEENQGQFPDDVAYGVKGRRKSFFFTSNGVTLRIRNGSRACALKPVFANANPLARLEARERRRAVFSCFRGANPDRWVRGAPAWGKIVYRDLWPGIDLECARGRRSGPHSHPRPAGGQRPRG